MGNSNAFFAEKQGFRIKKMHGFLCVFREKNLTLTKIMNVEGRAMTERRVDKRLTGTCADGVLIMGFWRYRGSGDQHHQR